MPCSTSSESQPLMVLSSALPMPVNLVLPVTWPPETVTKNSRFSDVVGQGGGGEVAGDQVGAFTGVLDHGVIAQPERV